MAVILYVAVDLNLDFCGVLVTIACTLPILLSVFFFPKTKLYSPPMTVDLHPYNLCRAGGELRLYEVVGRSTKVSMAVYSSSGALTDLKIHMAVMLQHHPRRLIRQQRRPGLHQLCLPLGSEPWAVST